MRNESMRSIGNYTVYARIEEKVGGEEIVLGYFVGGDGADNTLYSSEGSAACAAQRLSDEPPTDPSPKV